MSCQDVQERLTDALLGEAPPSVREELLDHAAGCAGCAEAAEQLRQTLELLRGSSWPAEMVLGDAERRRLFERARTSRAPIRWIAAAASLAAVAAAAAVGVPALQRARREPVPPVPPPAVVEAVPPVRPTPPPAATGRPEFRTLPPAASAPPPPPSPAPTIAPAPVVVAAREPVVPSRPRDVPPARPRRFPAEEPDPVGRRETERLNPLEAARGPQVAILGAPAAATDGWTPSARGRTSRFGFDVGSASLALVREALLDGRLPEPSAVRVGEFVNAVPGGEPPPQGQAFAVDLEAARSPFDPSLAYLRVGIRAREVARGDRRAVRLVFVVDLSESMGAGERLDLLKRNLRRLVERLDGGDSIGIVAYGSGAHVVLSPLPGDAREAILEAVASLAPEGSTGAAEALQVAYGLASGAFEFGALNRVVLCTDGADGTPVGAAAPLLPQIRRRAATGIELAVLALGRGDDALHRLARDGRGPYASVQGDAELRRFLLSDLSQVEGVVARAAQVEVEFDPARVRGYRLLGQPAQGFPVPARVPGADAADGSEVHGGQTVAALYELRVSPGDGALGTVRVRFEHPDTRGVDEVSRAIRDVAPDRAFDDASPRLQLTVLAGRFAQHLRREPNEPFRLLHVTAQRARPRVSSLDRDLEILPMIRAAGRLLGVRE
jgi:Ca-activated chloride channel family protein